MGLSGKEGGHMVKFIGLAFIVFSSSGLGYILGSRFNMRVRELRLLRAAIQMLETEVVYSNTPLPDAFESIYKRCSSPINELFRTISSNLTKRTFDSVGEAFSKAVEDLKRNLSLSHEDIEILKSFGHSIGNSDIGGQVKSYKMILKQLEIQESKAEEQRSKNEKMYKSLGTLSGLAIAILLL